MSITIADVQTPVVKNAGTVLQPFSKTIIFTLRISVLQSLLLVAETGSNNLQLCQ